MSFIGKEVRLAQSIHAASGTQVCIAMDHSPAIGPVEGLIDPVETIKKIAKGKPDTIFTHYGVIKKSLPVLLDARLSFMLSISTATTMGPDPSRVYLVDSVLRAVQIGASGVSMRLFVGAEHEMEMIKSLALVVSECEQYGMPVMAMMYPYNQEDNFSPKSLMHASRLGAELGADIVKTYYSGNPESFRKVTESCPAPIVMSGGPKTKTEVEFLESLKGAMDGGAMGVAVGRNAWQHDQPEKMVQAINAVVHKKIEPKAAYEAAFKV